MGLAKFDTYDNVLVDDADPKFLKECNAALETLNKNALGKEFLTALSKTGKKTVIRKADKKKGAAIGGSSACSSGPAAEKYPVLRQLFTSHDKTKIAAEFKKIMGLTGDDKKDGLALDGFAKVLRFLDAPCWDPKKPIKNPFKDLGVADVTAKLKEWASGDKKVEDDDQANMLLMAFADKLTPGAGSGSAVYWDTDSDKVGGKKRPTYIGLAHELIHSYHSARGMQLGIEGDYSSSKGVLYEALCVGLKPHFDSAKTHKFTENSFRAQFKVEPRTEYNV